METKKSKKKRIIPRAIDLSIRLIVELPQPDEEGRWTFLAICPTYGTSGFRIKAKTSKAAKATLEGFLANELEAEDDEPLVADD